jgi:bifunctional DNA-binding transcriptional regulator/antitoxin component of YhaV-PrlF toxin-antitoxin module
MIRYKPGDVLQFKNSKEIKRIIIKATSDGYIFTKEVSGLAEDSSETNDPYFEDGWRIYDND